MIPLSYSQSSGILSNLKGDNFALGYSGRGQDRNVPEAESHKGSGPIPRGKYTIGPPQDSPHMGPLVFELIPDPSNEMFGRSGFFVHGDSCKHPGAASDGCMCFSRPVRESIAEGLKAGNDKLEVVE